MPKEIHITTKPVSYHGRIIPEGGVFHAANDMDLVVHIEKGLVKPKPDEPEKPDGKAKK